MNVEQRRAAQDASGEPSATAAGSCAPLPWRPGARLASIAALIAADIGAWLISAGIVVLVRTAIWGTIPLFWGLYACGSGWILLRFSSGLYPPAGMSQPEELRRSVRATAAAALIHLGMLIALHEYQGWRIAGLGVWVLVVPIAYLLRGLVKSVLIRRRLFGDPYVIVGTGEKGNRAIREMQGNPELGLVPVAAFGDELELRGGQLRGVPVLGRVDDVDQFSFVGPIRHAMIALEPSEANADRIAELTTRLGKIYSSVRIFADLASPSNLWVQPYSVGPYVALEIPHARLSATQRLIKRSFDLIVTIPLLIVAGPIIGVSALLVKVTSPGPAFFSQSREGLAGKPIRIWKIRSMVMDAEKHLTEYLSNNMRVRFEYERTFKLRHDPRVIPGIGRLLRRTNIDELPQLWSVLKGDMSLVGPRVMLGHEVSRFSASGQELRRGVPPGMTGLWQVMYRNNTDLQIWELADTYYVHNWSPWLDFWILLRTARVLLTNAGGPDVIGLRNLASPEDLGAPSASILLAEDLAMNQLFVTAILRNGGYEVEAVGDGRAAVEAMQRQKYDLVLMDVQMPVLDGLEATRQIRSLGEAGKVPIIALTANSLPTEIARCRAAGMDAHVAKPIDGSALLATIAQLLGSRGGEAVPPQAEPQTPAEVVLDEQHLTNLARLLEPAEFDEVVNSFLVALPKHLNEITAAASDCKKIEWAAHALISLGGNLGLVELSLSSRRLRDACRYGKAEMIPALLHELRQAAARATARLK